MKRVEQTGSLPCKLLTETDIAELLHQDPVGALVKVVLDHQQVAHHAGRHALLHHHRLVGAVDIEHLRGLEEVEVGMVQKQQTVLGERQPKAESSGVWTPYTCPLQWQRLHFWWRQKPPPIMSMCGQAEQPQSLARHSCGRTAKTLSSHFPNLEQAKALE